MRAAMLQAKLMCRRAGFPSDDLVFIVHNVEEFFHACLIQKSKVKGRKSDF
jgi:hypothetical protein